MVILLNPFCSYGEGLERWRQIEAELAHKVGPFVLETLASAARLNERVRELAEAGETMFVAAGGDGTVNLLLNALLPLQKNGNGLLFGAIGLGSSNDYHKPMYARDFIHSVPVRINPLKAPACDVICIRYTDPDNMERVRFCLNNASVGVTAEANELFNRQPNAIRNLRKLSVNTAITAAAIQTMLTYRNIPCRLTIDQSETREFRITNLGIVKNPHFAGSLKYEAVVQPDNGWLGVHLCEGMSRFEAIGTLVRLSKGEFGGHPKTQTWRARKVTIQSDQPIALEMDGEIVTVRKAEFTVLQRALRCCQ